jgi:hypothetical protein
VVLEKGLKGLLKKNAIFHWVELHQEDQAFMVSDGDEATIYHLIKELLEGFKDLFAEPQSLPPHRAIDHQIPLVPGAQQVNVRPYCYSPHQKTEIERQVQEMLQSGIIQLSSSPFASLVLLVKKRDRSWQFCVDYRALNALTVKNKHPLPVVEELLDELAGAEDEHKMTFHTHQGLYEFLVMPFGLTNAPATLQHIINSIFSEFLHRFVLVYMDDILVYNASLEDHAQHLSLVFQTLAAHQFFIKPNKCASLLSIPWSIWVMSSQLKGLLLTHPRCKLSSSGCQQMSRNSEGFWGLQGITEGL